MIWIYTYIEQPIRKIDKHAHCYYLLPAQLKLRQKQDSKHFQFHQVIRITSESPQHPFGEGPPAFEVVLREAYICAYTFSSFWNDDFIKWSTKKWITKSGSVLRESPRWILIIFASAYVISPRDKMTWYIVAKKRVISAISWVLAKK